jgi:hypothetical protein
MMHESYLLEAALCKSQAAQVEQDTAERLNHELLRPYMLLRPKVYPDGNQWCALLGDDLQSGVCGFGDTPDLATRAFDKEWHSSARDKSKEQTK